MPDEPAERGSPTPDPDIGVVVLASLSEVEAHLFVGRLEAEGIRAIATPGGGGLSAWVGVPLVALLSSRLALLAAQPLAVMSSSMHETLKPLPKLLFDAASAWGAQTDVAIRTGK